MRKVAYLMIMAGLILLLYPTISLWASDQEQRQLLEKWEAEATAQPASAPGPTPSPEVVGRELDRLFADGGGSSMAAAATAPAPADQQQTSPAADTAQPKAPTRTAVQVQQASRSVPAKQPKVVGILQIGTINLKLPVVEGVSAQDIKAAPGHIPGTALPGEIGNAVIAGHRSYSYGRMFNRLEELEPGDPIRFQTGGQNFEYIIYDKKMVDPTDVSVLNQTKTDKILTLITCDEEGKQRLILHAKLK